jgi:hypothetical protein
MRKMFVAALAVLVVAAFALADTTYRHEDVVQNMTGAVVGGATITVYDADTSTQATIYRGIDTALGTKGNPTTTDSFGRYWFYGLPGRYDIKIERAGIVTYTREDVYIGGYGSSVSATAQTWPSVKDWGATGNGTTADRDSIQAAVDAIYDSGNGSGNLLVPAGRYLINVDGATNGESTYGVVLYDGVTLVGEPGAVFVLETQQGSGAEPYPESHLIYADDAVDIGVIGIEFDLQADTQPSGDTHDISAIKFNDCSNITIEKCKFDGGVMNAVSVYSFNSFTVGTNLRFIDNEISDSEAGLYLNGVIGAEIENLTTFSSSSSSIELNISSGIEIDGLRSYGTYENGIDILGSGAIVTSSSIMNSSGYGINIAPYSVFRPGAIICSSNIISMNTSSGDAGIYVENASSVTLVGNEIFGSNWDGRDGDASIGGIVARQTGIGTLSDFVVTGNIIRNIDRNYPGGLIRAPAAISIYGDGGEVRGLSVGDNAIDNCYIGIYSRPTGARGFHGGSIRNCYTRVDSVQVVDNTAPVVVDSTGTSYSITGDVVWLDWAATTDESSTAIVTWYKNATIGGVFSLPLATQHGEPFSTGQADVEDDEYTIYAIFSDVIGNPSDEYDFGTVTVDTIPADPTDTTPPNITSTDLTEDHESGIVMLDWTFYTDEDNEAMKQVQWQHNDGGFTTLDFDSNLVNTHTGIIDTRIAPVDQDSFDIYVYLEDESGNNTGFAPMDSVVVSFYEDNTAPTFSDSTYTMSAPDGGNVTLYWTAHTSELAEVNVEWSHNGGLYSDENWTGVFQTSHSGVIYTGIGSTDNHIYEVQIQGRDLAGNTSGYTDLGIRTVSITAAGDPAIESVIPGLGGFSDGIVTKVAGDHFGSKDSQSTDHFDNTESGSISPYWSYTGQLTVSNESRHAGSGYAYNQEFQGSVPNNNHGYVTGPSEDVGAKWFVSYWFKLDSNFDFGTSSYGGGDENLANVKLFRMWAPGSGTQENYVCAYAGYGGYTIVSTEYVSDIHLEYWDTLGDASSWTKNVWHNLQVEYLESDVGVSNGGSKMTFDGVVVHDDFTHMTREDETDLKRPLIVGFFNSWTDANTDQDDFYMDDIYVDRSWARVELGNASTYANCTHKEVQPIVSWSNQLAEFEFNSGSFSDGDLAYLFLVNEDGTASAGELIEIGGTSNPAPSGEVRFSIIDIAEQITIVADTTPSGGVVPDGDMILQWKQTTDSTWLPTDAAYSGNYRSGLAEFRTLPYTTSSPLDTVDARVKMKSEAGSETDWIYSGRTLLSFGVETNANPPEIISVNPQLECNALGTLLSVYTTTSENAVITDMRFSFIGNDVLEVTPDRIVVPGASQQAWYQLARACSTGAYYDIEVTLESEHNVSTGWIALDRVTVPSTTRPAITSIAGDWDGDLVITGTAFGGKTINTPVEWETWQSYTAGPVVNLDSQQSKWAVSTDNTALEQPHVSTLKPRYSGNKNLRINTVSSVYLSEGYQADGVYNVADYSLPDTVFVSFWMHKDWPGAMTRNMKFFSLSGWLVHDGTSGSGKLYYNQNAGDTQWNLYPTHRSGNTPYSIDYPDCSMGGFDGFGDQISQTPNIHSEWFRTSAYFVQAAACDVDGGEFHSYGVSESMSLPEMHDEPAFNLKEDTDVSDFDQMTRATFKNYLDEVTDSGADLAGAYYYDDFYLDNTWSRVEVGNASVYDQCTHLEMLPPTAWANTEITVTGNAGSFEDGETVYVFVFNDKGVPSEGEEVTIGTTAPPPPDVPVIGSYQDAHSSPPLISSGLISADVTAAACVQWKLFHGGSWAPADTTLEAAWTSYYDPMDDIEFSLETGYTPSAGDSIHFRATVRTPGVDGVHAGVWTALDSYYENEATVQTWLYAMENSTSYIGGIDPADYDNHTYGVGTEGNVKAADIDDNRGAAGVDWHVKVEGGGGIPYADTDDGTFYLWYPGPIGTDIAGETVTSATLHLKTYNSTNDLSGAGEGLVITAITSSTFNDYITTDPWEMSWAYSDSTTSTAWSPAWTTVAAYSTLGTSVTYPIAMIDSRTEYEFDVTSILAAVAAMGTPANFGGFAIHLISTGPTYLGLYTADGGTVTNHPVLEITTE